VSIANVPNRCLSWPCLTGKVAVRFVLRILKNGNERSEKGSLSDMKKVNPLNDVRLTCPHSANLYEIIQREYSRGQKLYFDILVDDLKIQLHLYEMVDDGLVLSYPRFNDFRRDVIRKSLSEICELTEISDAKVQVTQKIARKSFRLRISYQVNR